MGIHAQPREIDVPKDNPFKHDLLDRREAVETLTHLVANLDGPCVLAVDAALGRWKDHFFENLDATPSQSGFSPLSSSMLGRPITPRSPSSHSPQS